MGLQGIRCSAVPLDGRTTPGKSDTLGPVVESFFEEVVRYLRFSEQHQAALRAFHATAAPSFAAVAERFYGRIAEHEEARRVFKSSAQVERLKVTMAHWLAQLLLGPWDSEYFERRARIGRRHVEVGLPQRYMLTAMNHIRDELSAIARAQLADEEERTTTILAVNKILDLELSIMLETYREDSISEVTRVQRMEREVLQHRLKITEARYQAIIETAEVLVIAADTAGHVVLFNRKAEEVFGISRAEVAATDVLADLLPEPEREEFFAALEGALASQSPPPLDGRVFSRTGDEHWIRWHVTTLASSGDPFVCALGVDQTEERALEAQSRRAERLAALGTLAAGLAHEIRNPLNAAQLQLLLVERRLGKVSDRGADAALDAARVVKAELGRLGGLVEDFLAFARPTSLRLKSGDLVDTVNGVVNLLEPDIRAAGVGIRVIGSEPVAARYDDERVRQVLHNLVRNAIEAAGAGGAVEVQILRERNRAVLEVRDDGGGPPEGLDLFQPFETSKDGGTGLGLSIVHRIVSDHGGIVEFDRRGGWTVFRVELPIDGPDGANRDYQTVVPPRGA